MENKIIKIFMFINIFIITFLSPLIRNSSKLEFIYLLFNFIIFLLFVLKKKIKSYEYVLFFYSTILMLIYSLFNTRTYLSIFLNYQKYLILFLSYINFKNIFYDLWGSKFIKFTALLGNILTIYCIIERFMQRNVLYSKIFGEKYSYMYSDLSNNFFYNQLGVYRISGSMEHPIVIANALLFFSFLNIFIYLKMKKKIHLLFSILNLLAIIFTESRSAYISYAIGIVLFAWIYLRKVLIKSKLGKEKKFNKLIKFIVIIIIIFIFINKFKLNGMIISEYIKQRFLQILNNNDSGSYYQRVGSINFILDYMKNETQIFKLFLGNGFGRLANYLKGNQIAFVRNGFYVVDNQYITLIYDIGILNFTLLIIWFLKKIIVYLKALIKIDNFSIDLIIPLILVVAISINIFFYDAFTWISSIVLIGYSLALLAYTYEGKLKYKKEGK